jgi:hypothetical protein
VSGRARLVPVGLAPLALLMMFAAVPSRAGTSADSTAAPAGPAAPDSSMSRYLESLRDSTDRYFTSSGARPDTAGLDSAQAWALAHPGKRAQSHRLILSGYPWTTFNRVDGPMYGAGGSIGRRNWIGEFGGKLGYAVGSDQWLGSGRWDKWQHEGTRSWKFSVEAGRLVAGMNRDREDMSFSMLQGFLTGNDTQRYLRHDGFETSVAVDHPAYSASVAFRNHLESPLPVTARWSLTNDPLTVSDNVQATRARVQELGYALAARVPYTNFTAEANYWTSAHSIGSNLEYRRSRFALGGDVGLGRALALVPQFVYGHMSGDAVPQEAFYLGGTRSLRSIHGDTFGGTGLVLARVDLIEMPDVLEVLHIPHPAMTPIQLALFAATGSVWGADPYGGPAGPGTDWPDRESFRSDAGFTILYRPGLPDPFSYLRINWGWPIGPHHGGYLVSVGYSRGVDLVHMLRRGDSD